MAMDYALAQRLIDWCGEKPGDVCVIGLTRPRLFSMAVALFVAEANDRLPEAMKSNLRGQIKDLSQLIPQDILTIAAQAVHLAYVIPSPQERAAEREVERDS